jgi:hypothetical protein
MEENGFPFGDYLLVSGFLDRAKPELEKAGLYLGLDQLHKNPASSSSASSDEQPAVTVSTSRRGRKKTNEQ